MSRPGLPATLGLLLLGLATTTAWAQAPSGAAVDELLTSARAWEAHGRADLARVALNKLLVAAPDHPEGLLQLGLLELQANQMEAAAKVLQRLRASHPDDRRVRELEDAQRIATKDRMRMANVRRLLQSGEIDAAMQGMRELFPEGPPGGLLGIEYYRALARVDGRRDEGLAGLQRLLRENPGEPEFEIAIARHYLGRAATRPDGLARLEAISARPDVSQRRVLDLWRDGLSEQPGSAADQQMLARYLRLAPDDQQMLALQARWQGRAPAAEVAAAASEPTAAPVKARPAVTRPPPPAQAGTPVVAPTPEPRPAVPESAPAVAMESGGLALALGAAAETPTATPVIAPTPLDLQLAAQLQEPPPVPDTRAEQIEAWQTEARAAQARGDLAGARKAAEQALALAPEDPWLRYRLARLELSAGDSEAARARMAAGVQLAPGADMYYAQALLLAGLDPRAAQAALARIPAGERSEGMLRLQSRLQMRPLLAAGQRLLLAQDQASGEALLEGATALAGEDPRLQAEVAQTWIAAGQPGRGRESMRRYVETRSETPELLLAWGGVLDAAADRAPDADTELDALLARLRAEPLADADLAEERAALIASRARRQAQAQQAGGDSAGAFATLDSALREAPREPALLTAREALLDDTRPQRESSLMLALDLIDKPGDAGISRYRGQQLPLRYQGPLGRAGRLEAQIDAVSLDAGRLPAAFEAAAPYGQLQAVGPTASGYAGVSQSAEGWAPTVGYSQGPWRGDIGSTPLGFPVVDVVGGLRYGGDWGQFDYAVEAHRRPLTSSLLAYAGARDPLSGEVWGGVRDNGLGLRLARYERRWSGFVSTGYSALKGEQVADNRQWNLRLGGDWELLDRDDQRLYLGLTLSHQRYAENLRYYSFGQGGYYSPQRRSALSLPLDWRGRYRALSWQVQAVAALTRTYEDDSLFFPTRPDLQAAAATRLAASGESAVYEGGDGGGFGYSLMAALEYRLSPHWTLGGRTDLDRSEFYEPLQFNLYLRRWLDGAPEGPLVPPQPLRPNSER
ncbi:MAG: tetratricopeptide repeat protein [Nevskiaceae bacterium]|nr:MAG: tetratricopeptide repeat protein [Nevskiaceae bacterium]TAM28961.1 MAG: tetratricopeptide repeat protein [Nevskiaceae bacterium]